MSMKQLDILLYSLKINKSERNTMAVKKTLEEFVEESQKVHKHKYTYKDAVYVTSKTDIEITCPRHGNFFQQPNSHLRGSNCPECATEIKISKLIKPFNTFLKEASDMFNTRFIYLENSYVNYKSPIKVICNIHGEFQISPQNHLTYLEGGCEECKKEQEIKKYSDQFITKAIEVHKNMYSYKFVEYVNTNTKVSIICKTHGSFPQTPEDHLSGRGCPKCGAENRANNKKLTTAEWIDNAKAVHGDRYNYSKLTYIDKSIKVEVICKEHGSFWVIPGNHTYSLSGCPDCAGSGFNKNKPAYLYYLKIATDDNKILYKVGITNRTVNERFTLKELKSIEIIAQKLYQTGQEAYIREQDLLKKYKHYKYHGPKVIDSGNTELFTEDILRKELNENYYFG